MQTNLLTNHLAEIQVRYKTKVKYSEMPVITSSRDAERILRSMWSESMEFKEEFYILLLNRANRVKGYYKVSEGGTAGTAAETVAGRAERIGPGPFAAVFHMDGRGAPACRESGTVSGLVSFERRPPPSAGRYALAQIDPPFV